MVKTYLVYKRAAKRGIKQETGKAIPTRDQRDQFFSSERPTVDLDENRQLQPVYPCGLIETGDEAVAMKRFLSADIDSPGYRGV
jgi:hypothetical protein